MLYVSSSCSRQTSIGLAVRELADHGYTAVELSGGTRYQPQMLDTLLALKKEYRLNILLHNYFPPPQEDFVINLASLDDTVQERSILQLTQALDWSRRLGGDRFGFHAGFFFDPQLSGLGQQMAAQPLAERWQALDRFCQGWGRVSAAAGGVKLYVENNVYSLANYRVFEKRLPFMLLSIEDYQELRQMIPFAPLLDVAHLRVTCRTLGLDFSEQLRAFLAVTDYIHLSDNDGLADSNDGLRAGQGVLTHLGPAQLQGKTITLEVYDGLESLARSYAELQRLCS